MLYGGKDLNVPAARNVAASTTYSFMEVVHALASNDRLVPVIEARRESS
jgi:hypothetical protein